MLAWRNHMCTTFMGGSGSEGRLGTTLAIVESLFHRPTGAVAEELSADDMEARSAATIQSVGGNLRPVFTVDCPDCGCAAAEGPLRDNVSSPPKSCHMPQQVRRDPCSVGKNVNLQQCVDYTFGAV